MSLSREIINALLPDGKFWEVEELSDLDKLYDGIAANSDAILEELEKLGKIRDPFLTHMLSDLEKEYGIIKTELSTEDERRQTLDAFMHRRSSLGAYDTLQEKLRDAGFTDVYVHVNSPAVNPDIFLAQAFNMVCGDLLPGGNFAQCGEVEAICAQVGGELVVNGDLFESMPNYVNLCGELVVQCGDDVLCGDFDGYKSLAVDIDYVVPTESGYWPLIFFVGGPATRDITGAITEIQFYSVPFERRTEFRRIILKFKPLFSWGGLIVVYN